jgi:hypothetical protein
VGRHGPRKERVKYPRERIKKGKNKPFTPGSYGKMPSAPVRLLIRFPGNASKSYEELL